MNLHTWTEIGKAALIWAAVVQTMFVIIYGTRRWWASQVGKALFLKSATLALLLDSAVANLFLTYRYQLQVGVVLVVCVAVAVSYQLIALVRQIELTGGLPWSRDYEDPARYEDSADYEDPTKKSL